MVLAPVVINGFSPVIEVARQRRPALEGAAASAQGVLRFVVDQRAWKLGR